MATKKTSRGKFESNLRRARETYLKKRAEWQAKGFKLGREMGMKKFKQKYRQAIDANMHNIARQFAAHERVMDMRTGKKIEKAIEKQRKKILEKKSKGRNTKEDEKQLNSLVKKFGGDSLRDIVGTGMSRAKLFESLVHIVIKSGPDKGKIFGTGFLSRGEAEKVVGS